MKLSEMCLRANADDEALARRAIRNCEDREVIIQLVCDYNVNPVQSIQERCKEILESKKEETFEYFKKIAGTVGKLASNHYVYAGDNHFYESATYDFKLIRHMAHFYKDNPQLLVGHLDAMDKMAEFYKIHPESRPDSNIIIAKLYMLTK